AARSERRRTNDFFSHPTFFSIVLFNTSGTLTRNVLVNQSDLLLLDRSFDRTAAKSPLTMSTPGIPDAKVPNIRAGAPTFLRSNMYWLERYASCSPFSWVNRAISLLSSAIL